jgi:tRNA pseudouridine13 synthase
VNSYAADLPDWSRVLGVPGIRGVIRAEIEDFCVQELPLITPSGEGSHLWLNIEKRNANTSWVAQQLGLAAGVASRDVGYAGMKDRRALTTQWFSVALQEARDTHWRQWDIPDAVILDAQLHNRKLKRGALRGNRFRLVIRNLEGSGEHLESRLEYVREKGVPNYFGPQRFGHGGRNVGQGARWLEKGGRLPRNKRSIYLSAVRSFLFNEVLSRRVDLGNWNSLVDGDVASLDGSHSTFPCRLPDPVLIRRCSEFDIHPSGPLPGAGETELAGESANLEQRALEPHEALIKGLERAGLKSARRPLRLVPKALRWDLEGSSLVLEFELPSGGYATSLLRELVSIEPVTISKTA